MSRDARLAQRGRSLFIIASLSLLSACNAPSQAVNSDNEQPPVTSYVTASSLNCRAQPMLGADAVGSFKKGMAVTTTETKNGWAHIQQGGKDCWGSSAYLSEAAPPSKAPRRSAAIRRQQPDARMAFIAASTDARSNTRHAIHHHIVRHHTVHRTSSPYDYGGCPCSGRPICIGPRGGRYCITSGGNKRYGV